MTNSARAGTTAGVAPTAPVFVVVVTWNSASILPALIDSLGDGLQGVESARVLVVDNDSADNTTRIAEDAGLEVLRTGANLGYAAAINLGAAAAPAESAVLVLNPDARLSQGCIATLLAELGDPTVGIVVPRILDDGGRTQPSLRRDPTVARTWGEALLGGRRAPARAGLSEVIAAGPQYDVPQDAEWATGAALLVSPACREAIGPWDPTFFLYSEETEYMQRARAAGFVVRYAPGAKVRHRGGDMEQSEELWKLTVRNRIGLFRRRSPMLSSVAFQAGVIVNEALRSPGSRVHRAGLRAALRPSRVPAGPVHGVVAFAGVDWWYHNRAHSDVQLLRNIARERPVLMVNSIGLRVPLPGRSTKPMRRIIRKARSTLRFVRTPLPDLPNFHVMTPVALPLSGDSRAGGLMTQATRWQVERVARWYLMDRPNVMVTIPSASRVSEGMRRSSLTFNRSDLQSAFPEANGPAIAAMEQQLLRSSDVVLYVSHALMDHDADEVGDREHFLDHGVDIEHFRRRIPSDWPDDLASIPGPRIGFFGGLDDYVIDFDLLEVIARTMPEASLVLVGDATCPMDQLSSIPNVHWLGARPYSDIPAYGSGFDVAIMPWLDNEWIRYCNPIKLKEYLALGLPVVSTEYPELERFRDLVRVGATQEDFLEQIADALAEPDDAGTARARRDRVLGDTWANKAQDLLDLLDRRDAPARHPTHTHESRA